MAKCRTCEAPVIWAETRSGKPMPLDEKPSGNGNMAYVNGKAWVATDEDRRLRRPLHTSHFATCPDAGQHRRG